MDQCSTDHWFWWQTFNFQPLSRRGNSGCNKLPGIQTMLKLSIRSACRQCNSTLVLNCKVQSVEWWSSHLKRFTELVKGLNSGMYLKWTRAEWKYFVTVRRRLQSPPHKSKKKPLKNTVRHNGTYRWCLYKIAIWSRFRCLLNCVGILNKRHFLALYYTLFLLPATALFSYIVTSPKCLCTSASQLGVFSTLNRTGNLNKAEE